MKSRYIINTIDSHTGGQPTRVITSGIPIRGGTLMEQRQHLRDNFDHIRAALMCEPRGHQGMFGAVICPATRPGIDFGIVWIDPFRAYLSMCGHGLIGIGVTAVECGLTAVQEPETIVTIDTPAGVVKVTVKVKDGRAESAAFVNIPAFRYREGVEIDVPGFGRLKIAISFGGSFFGSIRGEEIGIDVVPENTRKLISAGQAIRKELNAAISLQHPTIKHLKSVDLFTFYGQPLASEAKYKCIQISDGSYDRSPGGSGTSHMMALLLARGDMEPDETIVTEGICGSLFTGRILERVKVAEFDGIIPEVTGEAYLTGFHQFLVDPDDPFPRGIDIG